MLRRLLKLVLLLVVAISVSIGGTIFFMGRTAATTPAPQAEDARPVVPAPIFANLEPFTVTLYGQARNRILYTAITLRLGDEESHRQIQDYMPEVRDRILKVLSIQDMTSVQTAEGRSALAQAIRISLEPAFAAQLPAPQLADVLFTAFVVQ